MATTRTLLADTDTVLYFPASQEARHAALLRANEVARQLVQQATADGDDGRQFRVIVGIEVDDITVKQRGFLHKAVFPQIADQVVFPDGQRFEWRVWKEMFRGRFLGDRWELRAEPRWSDELGRFVVPKRKTPRRVRVSTEDLTIKQYSDYIDKVIDTAITEFGVRFDFVATEREAVRYVPKRTKKPTHVSEEVAA